LRIALPYLWVFIGAGLGGSLRHAANQAGFALAGAAFPAGTLFVNLVGCFLMGVLTGVFAFRGEVAGQAVRLFLTTGVLGGFTTFSAFSLDTALMWERGQAGWTLAYVLVTVVGSVAGVFAGLALVRALIGPAG
jgi:CrcB protein